MAGLSERYIPPYTNIPLIMGVIQTIRCLMGIHEWEEFCHLKIHDGGKDWVLNSTPAMRECKFCHKKERL